MRRLILAWSGSLVITASMVLVWPAVVERLGENLTPPGHGTVLAAATVEELSDCLDDPSEPAFVTCNLADGTVWAGLWTGEEFISEWNLWKAIYSRIGDRSTAALVLTQYKQEPDGAHRLALLILLGVLGEVPSVEGQPPAQEEPPSSVEGQPPAQEEPGRAEEPPSSVEGALNLSPNYRFVWNWGGSKGHFDGTVAGDISGWTYTGKSVSSWPPRLHDAGGDARCTFEGDPRASHPKEGWRMDCDLFWEGDATWTGQIQGRFYPDLDDVGNLINFTFKGGGHGTDGGDWSPIEVELVPCQPGAVC